jgi:hypothetical protein
MPPRVGVKDGSGSPQRSEDYSGKPDGVEAMLIIPAISITPARPNV